MYLKVFNTQRHKLYINLFEHANVLTLIFGVLFIVPTLKLHATVDRSDFEICEVTLLCVLKNSYCCSFKEGGAECI
jgi:hypothetical protein